MRMGGVKERAKWNRKKYKGKQRLEDKCKNDAAMNGQRKRLGYLRTNALIKRTNTE